MVLECILNNKRHLNKISDFFAIHFKVIRRELSNSIISLNKGVVYESIRIPST
jgi:hypothetical protein